MTKETLLELVRECSWGHPDTLLADGFEDAFIGIGFQCETPLAVYEFEKCIEILMDSHGMDYAGSIEYMEVNVVSAWRGKYTPIFLHRPEWATIGTTDEA